MAVWQVWVRFKSPSPKELAIVQYAWQSEHDETTAEWHKEKEAKVQSLISGMAYIGFTYDGHSVGE